MTSPRVPITITVPLVLLPGTLCDERLFEPLLKRLDIGSALVLPLDDCASPAAMAERLFSLAPRRFALLGFSLGGIVALEMAARRPANILGLALIGTNPRDVPASDHEARRSAARAGRTMGEIIESLWPKYVAAAAQQDRGLRLRIEAMAQAFGPETLIRQTELALARCDSRPRLPAMTMPSLVLAGAEDLLAPPALQRELATGLPDAELVLLPDVGHFAPLEAPDLVARHVANWLDRIALT